MNLSDPDRSPWLKASTLAWPVAAQQAIALFVQLTDRWLAGHGAGPAAGQVALQAAQTTCFYLVWMTATVGVLATAGITATVSRRVGAHDARGANDALHQALLIAAVVGMAGAVAGLSALPALLAALGLDGPAGRYAAEFLSVTFLLLPVQVLGSTATASLAAAGDTRTALWISGVAMLLNLPLAWLGFRGVGDWEGLGFAGIAWGTGVSQILGMAAVLAVLARGRAGLRLAMTQLAPDWPVIRGLLRISVPAAAESFAMVAGQMVFLTAVNSLGDVARAAHGIALGWETVAETFGLAFGVAAGVLVGQNLGSGRPREARRCGFAAYGLGAAGMSLVGVGFLLYGEQLFRFFCPTPEQEPIVAAGVPVLKLAAWSMPALASCHILSSALRGGGDTRTPLAITLAGFFLVRLPLTAWLTWDTVPLPWGGQLGLQTLPGLGLGLWGCWLAMQIDLWVRGVAYAVAFAAGLRRKRWGLESPAR
jgi:putative MATE family efflux protein